MCCRHRYEPPQAAGDKQNNSSQQDSSEAPQTPPRSTTGERYLFNAPLSPSLMNTEKLWRKFEADPPECIAEADVPFPDEASIRILGKLNWKDKSKSFNKLAKRWHPDKFTQRFGLKLNNLERDSIMERVTQTFQRVHEHCN